jgi:ribosome biogenesis GTPase
MAKKKKIRVDLRKNRSKPPRPRDWTRTFQERGPDEHDTPGREQIRAKGDLSRRRTIIQEESQAASGGAEPAEMPAVDITACLPGRVMRMHGLFSIVEADDGRLFRCAVRRLLRSLATDERNIVTTGDRVWIRQASQTPRPVTPGKSEIVGEGLIERVEPRHGLLTRASRGREHVIVANVDQVVIVMSLVEPDLKPHLIDRYLVSAAHGGIAPIICLNKADLINHAVIQSLIGLYSQLDIPTFLTSAFSGQGVDRLRKCLAGRETVFAGQSGVGKSSLLNVVQPDLALEVREVSEATQKGRHTTTTAELIRLNLGGWVVDTPGIRQFELWDIIPQEVEGFFPEFRPFVHLCGYPDCTHTHEDRCAIKRAVKRRQISEQRYISYLGLFAGEPSDS